MGSIHVLLAEHSTGETAGLMALAGIVGGAAMKLLDWVAARRDTRFRQNQEEAEIRRKHQKEDAAEHADHMDKLVKRLDEDRKALAADYRRLEDKYDALRQEFDDERLRCKGIEERVQYLEEKLSENGIPFRPHTHPALVIRTGKPTPEPPQPQTTESSVETDH